MVNNSSSADTSRGGTKSPGLRREEKLPLWMIAVVGLTLVVIYARSGEYREVLEFVWAGVLMTIRISVLGYAAALVIGLFTGLARTSKNPIVHTLASLYVEVSRGVPLLVTIVYVGFVAAPALTRWLGIGKIAEPTRAIVGLSFAMGAFLAEHFRAGIEAVGRGQGEAASSLGMTRAQAMYYIILPQAIRIVLPPLGNEFIAALKTSSLASVLAVGELAHETRVLAGRTFDHFRSWNTASLLYLAMTLTLSFGVRVLEGRRKGTHV